MYKSEEGSSEGDLLQAMADALNDASLITGHVVTKSGAIPFTLDLSEDTYGWVVSRKGVRAITEEEEAERDRTHWAEKELNDLLLAVAKDTMPAMHFPYDPAGFQAPASDFERSFATTTSPSTEPSSQSRQFQIHPRPNVKNWNRVNLGEAWDGAFNMV